ncbi:Tetratricopeptide repeat-containing protein [Duganella sp. CF458]|uniref:tetratricopeptide repeat protein n=1 Tax=Duganella sp. CF458 TaxID=1884368 RepID=UPI0008EF5F2C|nr:tetratricopeptide repeat protein [Duganella sp. CF458]SFF70601.1 Tetratricopeptide repeat-containing protein [Duganella sp. CF458]
MKTRLLALAAILCAVAVPASAARMYCGETSVNQHDFRTVPDYFLKLVHARHFTDDIEQGIRGESGTLGGDLEYTLVHIPNHPRALNTALRLAPRNPGGIIPGAKMPIECYFERAVRFYPDDSNAWLMYARFAYAKGRHGQALEMLHKALEIAPEDPAINYNIGLIYAKQKKFEQALPYAQKAYSLQFPLPALKQTLVKAGKWVEPPPPEVEAAETADAKGEERAGDSAAPAAPVKP